MNWIRRYVSAREFGFWRRYYVERPFDDQGAIHLPVAILSALTANANRPGNRAPAKASDFMPFRRHEERDIDDQLVSGEW